MDLLTLIDLHKKSRFNKRELDHTEECGCYYCCDVIKTKDITDWTDDGQTAICPVCGVDSIIPLVKEDSDTKEILEKMFKYYFNQGEN